MQITKQERKNYNIVKTGIIFRNISLISMILATAAAASVVIFMLYYVALFILAIGSVFLLFLSEEYMALWEGSFITSLTAFAIVCYPYLVGVSFVSSITSIIIGSSNTYYKSNRTTRTIGIVCTVLSALSVIVFLLIATA